MGFGDWVWGLPTSKDLAWVTSTVRIPLDSGWVGESGCFALVSFSVAVSAGDGLVLRRHNMSVKLGIESGG